MTKGKNELGIKGGRGGGRSARGEVEREEGRIGESGIPTCDLLGGGGQSNRVAPPPD